MRLRCGDVLRPGAAWHAAAGRLANCWGYVPRVEAAATIALHAAGSAPDRQTATGNAALPFTPHDAYRWRQKVQIRPLPYYADAIRFADRPFDLIVIDGHDRELVVAQVARLLRPGGFVYLIDTDRAAQVRALG